MSVVVHLYQREKSPGAAAILQKFAGNRTPHRKGPLRAGAERIAVELHEQLSPKRAEASTRARILDAHSAKHPPWLSQRVPSHPARINNRLPQARYALRDTTLPAPLFIISASRSGRQVQSDPAR